MFLETPLPNQPHHVPPRRGGSLIFSALGRIEVGLGLYLLYFLLIKYTPSALVSKLIVLVLMFIALPVLSLTLYKLAGKSIRHKLPAFEIIFTDLTALFSHSKSTVKPPRARKPSALPDTNVSSLGNAGNSLIISFLP